LNSNGQVAPLYSRLDQEMLDGLLISGVMLSLPAAEWTIPLERV
jgi:hypothetical protein